ncbi:site-2 protease family protein [Oceanidesulfovibrio marinus]|uniref:Site-2 protease family protein n=1 Tax=Oceanidesulfovibrio marinus TaxID=370038 RepID=A0A6P1ZED6_9BACT|nr:site-2 protease family protein [Oceanidesulfovibrio marinus]QJT10431.1 site-2 protease family protein [Oceanidesulfovibrio marinus]TVM30677.1 site-2 protease family protein [Oceanidesulfovibrio marinus]
MPDIATAIQSVAISFVPFFLGVICHEVAHGYVAYRLGDPTAKMAGRLTLNPIPHLDTMGTLVFVLTALLPSPIVFGWAKPVPVDPRHFKNPMKGMMLCSAAGPGTNILLAIIFALALKFVTLSVDSVEALRASAVLYPLFLICRTGLYLNLILAFLNLIPIPPLDGSKILMGFLPRDLAIKYMSIDRYGLLILILLLATGALGYVLWPLVTGSAQLILTLVGL